MSHKKVRIMENAEFIDASKDTEIYWKSCKRPTVIALSVILIVVSLAIEATLLWHRITWGFDEWIHEVAFFNFWHGTYIIMAGTALLILTCLLGIWSIIRQSIPGLAVTCVLHGTTMILLFVGSIAMMSDALTAREEWIGREILDLMDPNRYNFNAIKDSYLNNMYRIVECCGANTYKDYPDRFGISPPDGCINRRHAGGLYHERGCGEKFSIWLKAWAGSVATLSLLIAIVEIIIISWSYQLIKILKAKYHRREQKKALQAKTPPRSRKNVQVYPQEQTVPLIQNPEQRMVSPARIPVRQQMVEPQMVHSNAPTMSFMPQMMNQSLVQSGAPTVQLIPHPGDQRIIQTTVTQFHPIVSSPMGHQIFLVGNSDGNSQAWPNGNLQSGNIQVVRGSFSSESSSNPSTSIINPPLPMRTTSLRKYPQKRSHHLGAPRVAEKIGLKASEMENNGWQDSDDTQQQIPDRVQTRSSIGAENRKMKTRPKSGIENQFRENTSPMSTFPTRSEPNILELESRQTSGVKPQTKTITEAKPAPKNQQPDAHSSPKTVIKNRSEQNSEAKAGTKSGSKPMMDSSSESNKNPNGRPTALPKAENPPKSRQKFNFWGRPIKPKQNTNVSSSEGFSAKSSSNNARPDSKLSQEISADDKSKNQENASKSTSLKSDKSQASSEDQGKVWRFAYPTESSLSPTDSDTLSYVSAISLSSPKHHYEAIIVGGPDTKKSDEKLQKKAAPQSSVVDSRVVQADVHSNGVRSGPKPPTNSFGAIPYGYENLLPKKGEKLDEKAFVSTLVYDKAYNTDTTTTTSATSDDLLSSSDEEGPRKRPPRPRKKKLRLHFPLRSQKSSTSNKKNGNALRILQEKEEDEYNEKNVKRDGTKLFETSL